MNYHSALFWVNSLFLLLLTNCKGTHHHAQRSSSTFRYNGIRDIHNSRVLDSNAGLILEWNVKRNSGSILFRISAKRFVPHIVLGFTRRGVLDSGDFVVFGLDYNGSPYIYDMHSVRNGTLIQDAKQDWKVAHVDRSNGPYDDIIISISRDLDTCDKQDMILNEDLTHVVWDYSYISRSSNNNNLPFQSDYFIHFVPKGIIPIYFLDPEIPPLSLSNEPTSLQKWTIGRTIQLPARHTSYWCSISKGPSLTKKHHIVGFGPHFRDQLSEKHVHHQAVFRCVPPPGVDPVSAFERFANHPGHECYFEENPIIPVNLCTEVIHLWGVGGLEVQFPEDIGFPIGEDPNEYYMLETHYDNPEVRSDLIIENGANFYYTPFNRANDGGMIFVGYGVINTGSFGGLWAVPPQTEEFTIAGQCSPQCTASMMPSSGVEIFAVTLHAHMSSQRMRLRHFRDGTELKPIQQEEYYDFNFQQVRHLPVPVTILPGDHIIAECEYGTTWKNGSTVSGFSTKDEMCNAFIYLNKRLPFLHCSSEYPSEKISSLFGILNMTWDINSFERIVTSAVPQSSDLIGLRFSQVVDQIHWTNRMKRELQEEMLRAEHIASCPNTAERAALQTGGSIPSDGVVLHPKPFIPYQTTTTFCPSSSKETSTSPPTLPQEVGLVGTEVLGGWSTPNNNPHYNFPLSYHQVH